MEQQSLVETAEAYVRAHFEQHISKDHVFHSIEHVFDVVKAVEEISKAYDLNEEKVDRLKIAAWFHDTGYDQGSEGHEERSCKYAEEFLTKHNASSETITTIKNCIKATRMPQSPMSRMQSILCDADLSHLGNALYWDRCGRVRQELLLTRDRTMSDVEWVDFELEFMLNHHYHCGEGERLYGAQKRKHIRQLEKQRRRLHPELAAIMIEEDKLVQKKKKKKKVIPTSGNIELKQLNLGRGVETMFRTAYRTHVNLSSIADNKANIMLSINAIIISIIISSLVPQFGENPKLIIPTVLLLTVCLSALTLAILATRPKITSGKVTMEDIKARRSNLLFFGNFHKMPLEDFHHGMMEMITDSDFQYSTMTRDLYFLGIVLAKKYQFLRWCYGVFMYGLILAVIVFATIFVLN
jgi:predicted metal-dependent HD superfamily phosphohydrolase